MKITDKIQLVHGNSLIEIKAFAENSVDSIITDPPYEYGFMGKSWDSTGIAYNVELWRECLRVLKPGGYIMAFGSSRTHHRLMVAIEDAGFEIRDTVCWVFGSGFPKSLNIGKKIDEIQGNEREVVGSYKVPDIKGDAYGTMNEKQGGSYKNIEVDKTKGTSEFEGWGTALKPAVEYICMARKPLSEKTVAENCLKWGTGGINIDISRIENNSENENDKRFGTDAKYNGNTDNEFFKTLNNKGTQVYNPQGRFPANLITDGSEEVRECFPETGQPGNKRKTESQFNGSGFGVDGKREMDNTKLFYDSGNASRFFKSIIYQAKASKAERNRGCEAVFNLFEQSEGLEKKENAGSYEFRVDGSLDGKPTSPKENFHPTVKPIALMEYLIKMVTPKGGIVLDPFNGSGSTGCAAAKNGFGYIGIDMTAEYIKISEKRIKAYLF